MKKALTLSVILLLAPVTVLGACGGENAAETPAPAADGGDPAGSAVQPEALPDPHETDIADLPRAITVDNDLVKADIKFDEAIFGFAPAIAMDVVEDARIRLEAMQSDAKAYKEADPEYFRPYGLKIDWMVSGASGTLAGLEGFQFTYTGGAHGNYMTDGRIYNTLTGDQMRLADLFTDPGAASMALAGQVHRAIADAKVIRAGGTDSYETFLGESADAVTPPDILSGEVSLIGSTEKDKLGGFTLHFAPYEIGSYAEGAYHIDVPQADFHDFLKSEYADLFAGDPATVKRPDE